MTQTLTQKWLRQNILQYPQRDRVFTDIDAVINRFSTLRPKSDVYTYDDGRTQLLICIHGLLPISFRQASYNIPVAVWVTREYPRQPPIAYVVPTADMLVKAGKHVEVSGRCTIDYILSWERKSEGCNLAALLEAMQDQFSRDPPVYAKPKESTPMNKPQPPIPSSPSPSNSLGPPIIPPKPGVTRESNGTRSAPPNPVFQQPSVQQRSSEPGPPQYSNPQFISTNYGLPSGNVTIDHTGSSSSASGSIPVSRWSGPPPPPPPPPPPEPPSHYSRASVPIPNLLDEEPAPLATGLPQCSASNSLPPRPPNPELLHLHAQVHHKLSSELASLAQVMHLDAERLRAQQADLLLGEPAIRDEMGRLEAVGDVCRNVAGRLKQTVNQADQNVAELRRKGDPEVDELVCSTSIVHNQLINLVAEDNAIEDTIYHLHRALNTGRIDLERFLRTSRVLAEEQFMKRALIEKIQMGMPMGSQWS
ncbi:UEV domain-containing protein [Mycena floridula]|nr:UEV domain-containing protein [Mycena floridula]